MTIIIQYKHNIFRVVCQLIYWEVYMDLYMLLATGEEEAGKEKLLALNEVSECYGLRLTQEDAGALIVSRNEVLKAYDRIEWDYSLLEKLIKTFSASAYIQSEDYLQLLTELIEIFHYMKNQTEDYLQDDDIIEMLFKCFEEKAGGSIDLLKARDVEAYLAEVWLEILNKEILRGVVL